MLLQPVFVRDDEGNGIGTLVVIQDQLVDAGRMFDECLLDPFRTVFSPSLPISRLLKRPRT